VSARAVVLLTLVGLAVAAAPAQAGEYTVTACPSPLGVQPERAGWVFDAGGLNTTAGLPSCAQGIAFSIWLAGDQPAQHRATWRFDPPPELPIVGYRLDRRWHVNGTTGPTAWFYDYATAEYDLAGRPESVEYCSPYECPSPGPAGSDTTPPLVRSGILADRIEVGLGCGYSPYNCPLVNDSQGGGHVIVRSAQVTLRDSDLPRFAETPSGSLLAPGTMTGIKDVTVKATDAGGGLWRAALQVDGREVLSVPFDDRQGQCAQPFAQARPCAAAGQATLRFDTASLPDGAHQASVVVSDVTGTNQAIHGPFPLQTVNDPVACAPGKPGATLAGGLGKRGRKRQTVSFGRAARLAGRLDGAAAVVVLERIARRGDRFAPRAARVTPRPNGRVVVGLPAGPSRDIRLGYRAAPGDTTLRCTRTFRLRVRARARLDATPRTLQGERRKVRLFGRLPRAFLPAGGKVVQLEAFERGRWRTFKTVRTGKGGVFRTSYRFGAATRGAFPMRVRVVREAAYPYEPATSERIVVRVT
jgi:hypothetical protein